MLIVHVHASHPASKTLIKREEVCHPALPLSANVIMVSLGTITSFHYDQFYYHILSLPYAIHCMYERYKYEIKFTKTHSIIIKFKSKERIQLFYQRSVCVCGFCKMPPYYKYKQQISIATIHYYCVKKRKMRINNYN